MAGRSRALPRNIRACGQTGGVLPVYMEDYVGTYIRRLTESGFPECVAMVLVGQVMETEIGRCLFVKGAINASRICEGDRPVFGEDVWNEVYEKIRLYFPCDEVVGWCVAGPGFRMLQEDVFLRVHIDNFADSEKIFCCYESLEKELSIRICEGGSFRVLPGYSIYYEKNDEMQSYMLEEAAAERQTKQNEMSKEKESGLENQERIRKKSEEKEGQFRKDIMQLAAIACIIILIVSVMVGTDTLDKLKEAVNGIGVQLASDETSEERNREEGTLEENAEADSDDSEDFAFGDFAFLDEVKTSEGDGQKMGEEQQETEQSGESGTEQETVQSGQNVAQQQETAQSGQNVAEQQETAQSGQNAAGQQETAQSGQNAAGQQEATQTGEHAAAEEDNPNQIEEETVAVLSPSEYTRYIVKAGDTLAQICREVYGSVELLYYVCELNQLKDVDSICAGQELILPKK